MPIAIAMSKPGFAENAGLALSENRRKNAGSQVSTIFVALMLSPLFI